MKYFRFIYWAFRGLRSMTDADHRKWKEECPVGEQHGLASQGLDAAAVPELARPGGAYTLADWQKLPHRFNGGAGIPDRPCVKCGLPDRHLIHRFSQWISAHTVAGGTIENFRLPVHRFWKRDDSGFCGMCGHSAGDGIHVGLVEDMASDQAADSGEANPK